MFRVVDTAVVTVAVVVAVAVAARYQRTAATAAAAAAVGDVCLLHRKCEIVCSARSRIREKKRAS